MKVGFHPSKMTGVEVDCLIGTTITIIFMYHVIGTINLLRLRKSRAYKYLTIIY